MTGDPIVLIVTITPTQAGADPDAVAEDVRVAILAGAPLDAAITVDRAAL